MTNTNTTTPTNGSFVNFGDVPFYKIENSQNLKPFYIQVASASDIWIFMSSNGGVTAGRRNSDFNLFPYETDDRLHGNYDTGSRTYIKVGDEIWQPFANEVSSKYSTTQNIYKSYYGNSVMLEEINHSLNISYIYKYESSEKYGFVKTSTIKNLANTTANIQVLDGLMNILPHGVDGGLQANASNLVDAYKAGEMLGNNLAVYSLTTKVNDTPNPIEILKANVAFNTMDKNCTVYLTPDAIAYFKNGNLNNLASDCYGKKTCYFLNFEKQLDGEISYSLVLDSGFDHSTLATLDSFVKKGDFTSLYTDIDNGTTQLKNIVANADGLQQTGDMVATAHHYLNTLYNVMRGGTFENVYDFDSADFLKNVAVRNKEALNNTEMVGKIKQCKTTHQLKETASCDPVFYRLALEYMPLSFSRRHGDPSRPWNRFNINLKNEKGEKITNYEGNWRDIFQNWEALGLSYPTYYENMVAKFVNATTADGFNPYRINQDGIDWEKPEPENPFGGYGYWGDHQIVYLHRLLLGLESHFPQKLEQMLSLDIFSYANVPYLINKYSDILENSKDTITFDFARDEKIENLVSAMGTDGKLILKDNGVYTVCLTEKLLVPLLAKVSNLLVGGGIWMNTQRPEWNDANNAIVGIGLSMVTVYHVKAYIGFLQEIFAKQKVSFEISTPVITWLTASLQQYDKYKHNYKGNEKQLLDGLGEIFSDYRTSLYSNGLGEKSTLTSEKILAFLDSVACGIDYTITQNANEVYATYNLLKDDFTVAPMNNMLEGQSAVIGSGYLSSNDVVKLLSSMEKDLFQPQLKCHTLYPITMTKKFADKNNITGISDVISGITQQDSTGNLHFNADIVTSTILAERMENTGITAETSAILQKEYDRLFAHKEFTGRSQVMYKFEGIGCVYWHQNAKLALAVMETVQRSREKGQDSQEIYTAYQKLMNGFIYRKTPLECNAIPVEPYSHTSFSGQSEQAGMTGQVKESVIMRRKELGIFVKNGEIHFDKWFIPAGEFLPDGNITSSIYGVAVNYKKSSDIQEDTITLVFRDGSNKTVGTNNIPADFATQLFNRTGDITSVNITFA